MSGKAAKSSKEIGELNLNWEDFYSLAENCGNAFLPAYQPVMKRV